MAIKAGRVGVAPDQVDEFGNINSEATSGYTKQEADAKFETQTHAASTYETKTDAAALQPKTLAVPIELLNGSALTVEEALNGINEDKINKGISSTAVTDVVTGADVDSDMGNHIYQTGSVTQLLLSLSKVTVSAWGTVGVIPPQYRPKSNLQVRSVRGNADFIITPAGLIVATANMSDGYCYLNEVWLCDIE